MNVIPASRLQRSDPAVLGLNVVAAVRHDHEIVLAAMNHSLGTTREQAKWPSEQPPLICNPQTRRTS